MSVNKIKSFFRTTLVFILMTSCSTHPTDSKNQSQLKNMKSLPSFGFISDGHEYVFSTDRTEGYKYDCARFNVYKDSVLINSFPHDKISELAETYKSDISIEKKISSIIKMTKSLPEPFYTCQENPLEKEKSTLKKIDSALGEVMNFLVYGTLVVIASPIVVPFMISYYVNDIRINANLEKINFGNSPSEIRKILQSDYTEEKYGNKLVHIYDLKSDLRNLKLVFVYQDDQLMAYVWGFNNI